MESGRVSAAVNGWIDLIFGYKQKGKESEQAMNVYYYLTYEGAVNMDEISDQDRLGIETQVVHFGQTPSQLFTRAHPKKISEIISSVLKKSVNLPSTELTIYKKKNFSKTASRLDNFISIKNYHSYYDKSIYAIVSRDKKKIYCLTKHKLMVHLWSANPKAHSDPQLTPFKMVKEDEFDISPMTSAKHEIDDTDYLVCQTKAPIEVLTRISCLLVGGFLSGAVSHNLRKTQKSSKLQK